MDQSGNIGLGDHNKRVATVYRMVMPKHVCPYGRKSLWLLRRKGYEVDDRWLRTREETDAFKAKHGVKTTPQTFIDGRRIGGYDDLRRQFDLAAPVPGETSYTPIVALFVMTALMALAGAFLATGAPLSWLTLQWLGTFSMCVLALLKLQDVEQFSTMFLNYDLLAQRWVPYGYLYPFLEGAAGVLMIGHIATSLASAVALTIGTIGAVSVFKAVYIDRRSIKCACVGGSSSVPLGFVSLTENLGMIAMGVWMLAR